ncbi:hypothetical protein B0T20DRAFT_7005 [Sordaria brevicollis]|uniref:Uncharacterized protein n=1 Tax=Sordaria brevicollis TaxID=83679 RepID=A0AAE0PN17_SORBR|nr:hypothetical protein B0T20DRAFT_7005 [Sordaria brevicollis]
MVMFERPTCHIGVGRFAQALCFSFCFVLVGFVLRMTLSQVIVINIAVYLFFQIFHCHRDMNREDWYAHTLGFQTPKKA